MADPETLKGFYSFLGHEGCGLTAVNIFDKQSGLQKKIYISTPEEYAEIVKQYDGKGQIYQSVNPVRADINKTTWHTNADIPCVMIIFIDCDAKKEDPDIPEKELKNYAATEEEYKASWAAIDDINTWLISKGFKTGYSDKTGNGIRKLLPIPPIEITDSNREIIPLKIKAFLNQIRNDTGLELDAVHDPRRITGVPTTLNKKLETSTRKNRIREPMHPIPERDEDSKLKDYILQLEYRESEASTIKEENTQPPKNTQSNKGLDHWLDKDRKLNELYSGSIAGYDSRSEAELALYQKLIFYGFSDTEIDQIMRNSSIGKWKSAKPAYREHTRLAANRNQTKIIENNTQYNKEQGNEANTNDQEIISEEDYNKEIVQITDNKFELGILTNHFIPKYVEWAKTTTDAYSEYHIVSALWLLSVSTKGKVYVPLASDRVYANLWIQINGPSTIARKTVAVNKAKRIHETVEGEILLNPDFSRDGLLRELHENPIMPSIRDESSSLLSKMHQKYNDGIFALECQLYDRQSVKKSLAKAEDTIIVIHPYICRIYASTPEVYTKVMKIEDFECGWGYRWLHVYPRYKRNRRPLRLENDHDVDLWSAVLNQTKKQFNFFNNKAEFPMGISKDAMKIYQDITMGLENYAVERNNSYFNGIIGRGNDHIMKIAMLYELGKNEISLEIQVDSIIFATRFVIYSIECELGLINDLLENVEINKVEKVLHAIKKSNGSISHSKLLQNVRMYKEDINKCVEVLIEAELIEVVKVKSDKGKVATYYRLLVNEEDKIDFKNIFQNSDIFGFHDLDGIDIGKFVKLDKLDGLDKDIMDDTNVSNLSNSINLDSNIDNNAMDSLDVRRSTTTLPYETSNLSNLSNSTKCDKCGKSYNINELEDGPAGLDKICHNCQDELKEQQKQRLATICSKKWKD